jgi:TolA-binding protein
LVPGYEESDLDVAVIMTTEEPQTPEEIRQNIRLEMVAGIVFYLFIALSFLPLNIHPAHGGSDESNAAEKHFSEGHNYLLQGNEVKASEAFEKAIAVDKGYSAKVPDEYYSAGLILIKDPKKSNIGIHYLNKYLTDKPDKGKELAAVLYDAGLNMTATNKFMAHVLLENAMRLNPIYEKDEEFYLAYSVRSTNKAADMIKGGENFIRRFPQSTYIPEVMYLTGDAYFEMRKIPEARDYFKKVKDRFPDSDWGAKAAKRF